MAHMERLYRTEHKKERVSTEEDLRTSSSAASRAKEHNLRHLKEAIDSYEKKSSSSKRRACRNLRLDDLRPTARKLSFEASPDGKSHSNSAGISAHLNSRDRALIEHAHLFGNSSQLDPSPDIQVERQQSRLHDMAPEVPITDFTLNQGSEPQPKLNTASNLCKKRVGSKKA